MFCLNTMNVITHISIGIQLNNKLIKLGYEI